MITAWASMQKLRLVGMLFEDKAWIFHSLGLFQRESF